MNPAKEYGFAPEELGKLVFFNISAFGTPIKTAMFIGGQILEAWAKPLMSRHGRNDFPLYDEALYIKALAEANCFLLPGLAVSNGQIRDCEKDWDYSDVSNGQSLPPCFENYEYGFAVLRIGIVMQSLLALERAGLKPGTAVITEGGFGKDEAYNLLLSAALRENPAYLTDIAEATALGAAITAKMALTGKNLAELADDIDPCYREVKKTNMPELFSYRKAWTRHTTKLI